MMDRGNGTSRSDVGSEDTMPLGVPEIVRTSTFPPYAYGIWQAAFLAKRLGLQSCTAVELGVAGGNGLVELERLAKIIGQERRVTIECVGFDLGSGMPEPLDYRDMPYVWQQGFYSMDQESLLGQLESARLVLGDVAETGGEFIRDLASPIGFISFDLDYYSSTLSAMTSLFEAVPEKYLPRVMCYFDDIIGPHEELHSEFTGELLAIQDFNARSRCRKLAKIHGLRYKLLPLDQPWVECMYVLHNFDHPRYNDYIYPAPTRQAALDQGSGERRSGA